MSKTTLLISASAIVIALAACEGESKPKKPNQSGRYGYQGSDQTAVLPEASPSPTPTTDSAIVTATPTPSPAAATATNASGNYPYGTPVPGKPGFVTSPHSPYSGYVDVRGFPPGTEVKDPYTGKVFLVP